MPHLVPHSVGRALARPVLTLLATLALLTAVVLPASASAATIAAGIDFGCRVDAGVTQCWGLRSAPADLPPATAVAAGVNHACVLTDDAHVRCWGQNYSGQLGDGTTTDSPTASVEVAGLDHVIRLVAGDAQTCVLRSDGDALCWGAQVPGGTTNGLWHYATTPQLIAHAAVDVSAARGVVCAVLASTTHCVTHATGFGTGELSDSPSPIEITSQSDARELRGGVWGYWCKLTGSGGARCFGLGNSGQLGDGTISTTLNQIGGPVYGLTDAIDLATSGFGSCALRAGGKVVCWGSDYRGANGDGGDAYWYAAVPTTVFGLTDATEITAADGGRGFCARRRTGDVVCWGAAHAAGVPHDAPAPIAPGTDNGAPETMPDPDDVHAHPKDPINNDGPERVWGTSPQSTTPQSTTPQSTTPPSTTSMATTPPSTTPDPDQRPDPTVRRTSTRLILEDIEFDPGALPCPRTATVTARGRHRSARWSVRLTRSEFGTCMIEFKSLVLPLRLRHVGRLRVSLSIDRDAPLTRVV